MALEAKISDLNKRSLDLISKKSKNEINHDIKNESPIMSITYYSDMVKNGNLSVKYADLTETEANEILKKLNRQTHSGNYQKTPESQKSNKNIQSPDKNQKPGEIIYSDNNIFESEDKNDTININIKDIINNNQLEINQDLDKKTMYNDNLSNSECQDILDGLTSVSNMKLSSSSSEIDAEIIKSISESIKYADMPSDSLSSYTFSEIKSKPVKINNQYNQNSKNKNNSKGVTKQITNTQSKNIKNKKK
ncbi:hypothetical protein c7_R457 [Megavirus courdo7]|uniref:Uncharacterized protein n=6 Tax=Megamimivirinae TaxID=3044648 RepID=A0A2L2DM49_MIMIV|nr:hypothetical protein c7_R457 [Megavirus courdo7]AVG47230.1 hypothetical protein [Acanthamoeba polyphaga mimivirus]